MESYIPLLLKNPLFVDVSEENIQKLSACLAAREKIYAKDTFVFRAGDAVRSVYLILSGNLHIVNEDFWGNRSIIETMPANTLFGEAYTLAASDKHLVSVLTAEESIILEMDPVSLFDTCANGCSCHEKLIKNATHILAEKIVRLTEKLGHIAQRSTREKILSYLSKCARQAESNAFQIPYSRQQLADYLCVDRSALSHELSRLSQLKMIRYRKNQFELLVLEERF